MGYKLVRYSRGKDGVFGEFWIEGDRKPFMQTLEHAYPQPDGTILPKIPDGVYQCVRGIHTIGHTHPHKIDTFEVLGVEGHSGLLCCHVGNYNADSEGCVLSGFAVVLQATGDRMLTKSELMYEAFMARLYDVQEFTLEVSSQWNS